MKASIFSPDIQDFVRALDHHHVRYLLVGGRAVVYHGYTRFTKDIDFFYACAPEDAERLFAALQEFWGGPVPHVPDSGALASEGVIVQFGVPPNRIDLISVMGSVSFEGAWARRIAEPIEGEGWTATLPVVSKEDLIRAKHDAGRLQDLADIEALVGLDDQGIR